MKTTLFKLAFIAVFALSVTSLRLFEPPASAAATPVVALDTTKPVSEITAPTGGWNFRNHVIPVSTRLDCNSGACHGEAERAGRG